MNLAPSFIFVYKKSGIGLLINIHNYFILVGVMLQEDKKYITSKDITFCLLMANKSSIFGMSTVNPLMQIQDSLVRKKICVHKAPVTFKMLRGGGGGEGQVTRCYCASHRRLSAVSEAGVNKDGGGRSHREQNASLNTATRTSRVMRESLTLERNRGQ